MSSTTLFTNKTISGNSPSFTIASPVSHRNAGNAPLLGIAFTTLGTPTIVLEWKALDGNWYDTYEPLLSSPKDILFPLTLNGEVELRLNYTAGGGSSINAYIFGSLPL